MINFNDMFGNQNTYQVNVTDSQLDEFIDRVIAEKYETLYSLAQALQYKIQQAPMISVAEVQIYPLVIQRIGQRMNQGG